MLVVGSVASIMSGVITFQSRQLDKEREKVLAAMAARLADRDASLAERRETIRKLEERVNSKDEQIFRLLGLQERATTALDALAPVVRRQIEGG
jgi:hypothetical protein